MKLTKQDIEKTEEIGKSEKGTVLHILTKGGLSMIVRKSMGGAMEVVSTAPHPGIARFRAEQVDKSIQWENNLFKSETDEMYTLEKAKIINIHDESGQVIGSTTDEMRARAAQADKEKRKMLSNPANHYKHAQHESHKAGRQSTRNTENDWAANHDKNMMILMHTDEALKHYQMSGLNYEQAMNEHKKNMANHAAFDEEYEKLPGSEKPSETGWHLNNPPAKPGHARKFTGVGGNWSE